MLKHIHCCTVCSQSECWMNYSASKWLEIYLSYILKSKSIKVVPIYHDPKLHTGYYYSTDWDGIGYNVSLGNGIPKNFRK